MKDAARHQVCAAAEPTDPLKSIPHPHDLRCYLADLLDRAAAVRRLIRVAEDLNKQKSQAAQHA